MRISDWSSDVCSSDLSITVRLSNSRSLAKVVAPLISTPFLLKGSSSERIVASTSARSMKAYSFLRLARWACHAIAVRKRQAEIGGASCRERVCQYVKIRGDAGALKKKKTNRRK